MAAAPIVASLAEQPAYYALYALYADYLANNNFHRAQEYYARLRDTLRFIQPLTEKGPAYMPSWSLRLFTQREGLARFSPQQASAAWRLVQQMVEEVGPPAGWKGPQPPPARRSRKRPARRKAAPPAAAPKRPAAEAAPERPKPPFPRSPVDYRREV